MCCTLHGEAVLTMNYLLFLAAVDFFSASALVWVVCASVSFAYLRSDSNTVQFFSTLRHICYFCSKQRIFPSTIDSKHYVIGDQSSHGCRLMANFQDWFKLQRYFQLWKSKVGHNFESETSILKEILSQIRPVQAAHICDESLSFPPQTTLLIIPCLALFAPHLPDNNTG